VPVASSGDYDPELYLALYARVLRHRHTHPLSIDRVLPVSASPHELEAVASELRPEQAEVARITATLAHYPGAQLQQEVASWYRV
jgi:hypothetical protein